MTKKELEEKLAQAGELIKEQKSLLKRYEERLDGVDKMLLATDEALDISCKYIELLHAPVYNRYDIGDKFYEKDPVEYVAKSQDEIKRVFMMDAYKIMIQRWAKEVTYD